MGYQGQSGNYTDLETQHQAAGLYTALSGPIGIYYDPSSGVGMARSEADALNTYDQLLHPFDGWTFGAYAKTAGEFGVGEGKGAVNFVAGSIVSESPELMLADMQTGGKLSNPIAAVGESQGDGADFIQVPLFIGAALVGDPEVAVAADSRAAVNAAGAESRAAIRGGVGPGGAKMQRGFAMIGTQTNIISSQAELPFDDLPARSRPPHLNSKSSDVPAHMYIIQNDTTGELYKFGESARGIGSNGKSIRAEEQVNELNKSGTDTFSSRVTAVFKNKAAARKSEKYLIRLFTRSMGKRPPGNPVDR